MIHLRNAACGLLLASIAQLASQASWGSLQAADWPRFRGPNGSGVSRDEAAVPEAFSPSENLKWKAALPGGGVSSPIVVGTRVFVTCYSGYGIDRREPGDIADLKRHLLCFDAETGEQLWQQTINAVLPEDPYSGMGIPAHGYASHSPVSDGERVYAFFGKSGVYAFDMQGNQLWHVSLGTGSDPREWGSASSPIVYQDKLIVTAAAESEALVALDTATGKEVWRQEAGGFANTWGTPAIVELADGQAELVVSVPYEIWAFNPQDGKFRWFCEATGADQADTSVVVNQDLVYVVTGRGGGSIAVRAGGTDDVTKSHIVWTGRDSARFASPVVWQDKVYMVSGGILSIIDAKSGEKISQERLPRGPEGSADAGAGQAEAAAAARGRGPGGGRGGAGGGFGGAQDYASPIIADGKLYYLNNAGNVYVYRLGESLESLGVSRVTDESESFGGTPAVSAGRIYLRSDKHLYSVGK